MKGRWAKYLMTGAMVAILAACSSKPTDRGQQYKDGKLSQPFSLVNQPDAVGAPINAGDFSEQVYQIRNASPRLYGSQSSVYNAVQDWLRAGGDTRNMRQFGIDAWQMEGADNYGNVQFTGYYTPVIQARHSRQGEFQYPIYRMPPKRGRLPSRAEIYSGALSENYVLAYSNSLMDNFIMDVQGSGYIDFGDGSPLNFFSYSGKNGHAYRSSGKVLIDRGEVKKEDMSMQAIRECVSSSAALFPSTVVNSTASSPRTICPSLSPKKCSFSPDTVHPSQTRFSQPEISFACALRSSDSAGNCLPSRISWRYLSSHCNSGAKVCFKVSSVITVPNGCSANAELVINPPVFQGRGQRHQPAHPHRFAYYTAQTMHAAYR